MPQLTAREAITAAAEHHDWTITEFSDEWSWKTLRIKRGTRWLTATFDVHGRCTGVRSDERTTIRAGRREYAVDYLTTTPDRRRKAHA